MEKFYIYLVPHRIWLICPIESVSESMGSVLQNIFRDRRQINAVNAEAELIVRWNGKNYFILMLSMNNNYFPKKCTNFLDTTGP